MLAEHLGTKAVRAVATAVGKNPDYPQVPCHRVIRSSGEIGKYSGHGGKSGKVKLLREEGIEISGDRVQSMDKVLFNF